MDGTDESDAEIDGMTVDAKVFRVSQPLDLGGICAVEGCQDIVDQPDAAAAAGVPEFARGGMQSVDQSSRAGANWQKDSWDGAGSWNGNPKCYAKIKEVYPSFSLPGGGSPTMATAGSATDVNSYEANGFPIGDCWMRRSSRASYSAMIDLQTVYSKGNPTSDDLHQHHGRRPYAPGWLIVNANVDPFMIGTTNQLGRSKTTLQNNYGGPHNNYQMPPKVGSSFYGENGGGGRCWDNFHHSGNPAETLPALNWMVMGVLYGSRDQVVNTGLSGDCNYAFWGQDTFGKVQYRASWGGWTHPYGQTRTSQSPVSQLVELEASIRFAQADSYDGLESGGHRGALENDEQNNPGFWAKRAEGGFPKAAFFTEANRYKQEGLDPKVGAIIIEDQNQVMNEVKDAKTGQALLEYNHDFDCSAATYWDRSDADPANHKLVSVCDFYQGDIRAQGEHYPANGHSRQRSHLSRKNGQGFHKFETGAKMQSGGRMGWPYVVSLMMQDVAYKKHWQHYWDDNRFELGSVEYTQAQMSRGEAGLTYGEYFSGLQNTGIEATTTHFCYDKEMDRASSSKTTFGPMWEHGRQGTGGEVKSAELLQSQADHGVGRDQIPYKEYDNVGIWDDTFNINADSDPWFYMMAPSYTSDYFVFEVCIGNQRPEGNQCKVDSHRVGVGGCNPEDVKPGFPLDVCFGKSGGRCNLDSSVGCECKIGGSPDCVWESLYDHSVGAVLVLPALEFSDSALLAEDKISSATVKFAATNLDLDTDVLSVVQPAPLGFVYGYDNSTGTMVVTASTPVPGVAMARALQSISFVSTLTLQPTGRRTLHIQNTRVARADGSTPAPVNAKAYINMAITRHTVATAVVNQNHAGSPVASPTTLTVGFTNQYPLAAGGSIGITFKDDEFADLQSLRPFLATITGVDGIEGAARTVVAEPTRSAQAQIDGKPRTEVLLRVGEAAGSGAAIGTAIALQLNHVLRECPQAPESATVDIRTYNSVGATLGETLGVIVSITAAVSDATNHHADCQVEAETFPDGMTCVDGRMLYDLMMQGKAEADPAQTEGGKGHREVHLYDTTKKKNNYGGTQGLPTDRVGSGNFTHFTNGQGGYPPSWYNTGIIWRARLSDLGWKRPKTGANIVSVSLCRHRL
jgi:hypothetical protein